MKIWKGVHRDDNKVAAYMLICFQNLGLHDSFFSESLHYTNKWKMQLLYKKVETLSIDIGG